MQPTSRISLDYPIYSLIPLSPTTYAVSGGGGLMKSGIPNKLQILTFTPSPQSLHLTATLSLSDAPVSLAAQHNTLHSLISTGMKSFLFQPPKTLNPVSNFTHDLLISSTVDQSAIALSASHLVIASDEGQLTVLQFPHYELLYTITPHTQGVIDLVLHPSLPLIATTSRDKTALLTNLHTRQLIQALLPTQPKPFRTHIRAIRFTTISGLLFTAESNPRKGGWLAAWRSSNALAGGFGPVATVRVSADALTAFAVNSDATYAAACSSEGHVVLLRWNGRAFAKVWTTEPAKKWLRPPLPPHVLPVTGICFTEVGDCFLTASADYTVAVWPTHVHMKRVGFLTILFWALSLVISLFALLMVEDRHIGEGVRKRRETITPYLEPVLSNVRGKVGPALNKGVDGVLPYLEEAKPYLWRVLGTAKKKREWERGETKSEPGQLNDRRDSVNAVKSTDGDVGGVDLISETESSNNNPDQLKVHDTENVDRDVGDLLSKEESTVKEREDEKKPENLDSNDSDSVNYLSEESVRGTREEKPDSSKSMTEFSRIAVTRSEEKPTFVDDHVRPAFKESSYYLGGNDQFSEMSLEDHVMSEETVQVNDESRDRNVSDGDVKNATSTDRADGGTEPRMCGLYNGELHAECKVGSELHLELERIEQDTEQMQHRPAKIEEAKQIYNKDVRSGEATFGTDKQADSCHREGPSALFVEDFIGTTGIFAKKFGRKNMDSFSTVIENNVKLTEVEVGRAKQRFGCKGGIGSCPVLSSKSSKSEVVRKEDETRKSSYQAATTVAESGDGESSVDAAERLDEGIGYCNTESAKSVLRKEILKASREDEGHGRLETMAKLREMAANTHIRGGSGHRHHKSHKSSLEQSSTRRRAKLLKRMLKAGASRETG